jgi:amino-acid N-acetyltransferase
MTTIQITPAQRRSRELIIALLREAGLPANDLPAELDHFFVAIDNEQVIAAAGLEVYMPYGLLRSLVVKENYRNSDIGSQLVQALELHARELDLQGIFLLTETASGFFSRKNYKIEERTRAPKQLTQSSEFSHVCPQSAIMMKKDL